MKNEKAQFTPGPWTYYKGAQFCRAGNVRTFEICQSGFETENGEGKMRMFRQFDYWGEQAEADARLVSASPDLLSACEALISANSQGEMIKDYTEALILARAAIAKAKGETNV